MVQTFRIFQGAVSQAIGQLTANKLRSFLSLLGITIGIFCIIGIKAAVNSLEDNIKSSFEKLGSDMIFISKMPWNENPGENWWKYNRRPAPSMADMEMIQRKVKSAECAVFTLNIGSRTLKFGSNSVRNVFLQSVTYDYDKAFKLKFEKGRYFSPTEYQYGADVVVIGHKVSAELFGAVEPIGKEIILNGRRLRVIGVIEETGRSLVNSYDENAYIPYSSARKFVNVRPRRTALFATQVTIKALPGVSLEKLTDDVTGVLRSSRHLRPSEKSNFSINEMSIVTQMLDGFFSVLNLAGIIIGGFALLVGMFSVANIMFVSVKERTNIIGIKKALGAKKSVILLEFLIESMVLCALGGLFGLAMIYLTTWVLTQFLPIDLYLSFSNAVFGVLVSVIVGVAAGMIPALQAAKMDPVEAMRK